MDTATLTAAEEFQAWDIGLSGGFAWRHGGAFRQPQSFRVAPYWYTSLVVRRTWDDAGQLCDVAVDVHGPVREGFVFDPKQRIEQIAIAVSPEYSEAVVGLRCDEVPHPNQSSGAISVPTDLVSQLTRLSERPSTGDIAEALRGFVLRRIDDLPSSKQALIEALRLVRRDPAHTKISDLAKHLGMSERQLRRDFRNAVGSSPKFYGRLLRFQAVLDELDVTPQIELSDLAYRHGFSDQAHLAREFKSLLGVSPLRAIRERRAGVSEIFKTGDAGLAN